MAQYDGSIRINTEIEYKNAQKELKGLVSSISKTADKIASLRSKMDALKDVQTPTQEYKDIQSDIAKAETELGKLLEKQAQMQNEGKDSGAAWDRLNLKIQASRDYIEEAKSELQELVNSGKAFTLGSETEKYAEMSAQVEQLNQQMQSDTERQAELQGQIAEREERLAELRENAVVGNQRIIETVERIKQLEQEIADLKAADRTEGYVDYDSRIQELERLKQEVKDYANGTNEMQDSYKRLGQALTDLNVKLSSILRPIQKIQSAFAQDVKVSGYEKLQSSLGELGGIAIRAAETVKNAFATLEQGPTAVIHGLSSSLMNMANTVNSAIGSVLSSGLEKFGMGIGAVLEKLRQLASGIGSGISSALDIAKEKLAGFAGSIINLILHPFQTLKNVASTTLGGIANIIKGVLGSALEKLKNRAAGLAASIINGIVHPFQTLKNVASTSVKGISKLLSGMVSVAKKAGKAISSVGSLLKRATSSMLGFGKSAQKSNSTLGAFGCRFKSLALSLLIFNQISKAFNAMISGMKEGFGNLYNENSALKAQVDSLKASMLTLKNALAGAFSPILEVAIPYIQKLIGWITSAVEAVGQLIAALTGRKTYTKAVKQSAAASEQAAKATKKETDAMNKQLSSLDKLNNLTSNDNEDDSDGAGGVGVGGAGQMFEEVPIDDRFKDIAQWLKDMWEKADFTELGTLLGEKLKNALDRIDWAPIKAVAAKIGKSIGTLINGFVEVKGLGESIGRTIGESINTGITGINAFLDNTHWDSVGKFIGEGLNGVVNSVDFSGIGHYFAQKWNAIFAVVGEAARTFDWGNFGLELSNGINTAISDFDWAENGARLGDLVKGILDTIITFLENTNWQELGNKAADFIGSIDWTGVMERLSEGIGAVLGGLSAFLWGLIEDAWKSVIDWWHESAFEDGKFTITGLLDGILEALQNIGSWIYEHIFQPFIDGFKNAFGIHSPSTVMAEMGIYIMQGLLNGIKSLVSTVVGAIQDVWNGIKTVFEGFITFLTGVFTGDWERAWDGVVQIFEGVRDTIKGIVNGIIGVVEALANGVINGINFVIGALNGLSFDLPDWLPGDLGGKTFGFNIPELSQVSIPRLATGTVVPPNNEFLAVLGDNKREPEVVSPLSTIEQAVENAMRRNGGMGDGEITIKIPVEIDGNVLFELMKKFDLEQYRRTGRPSFQM